MRFMSSLERAVQTRGRFPAVIDGETTRTWAEVGERVARLAGGLAAMGVEPGDRVAILAMNSADYLEALYAIARAGAVSVPLNTRWSVEETAAALLDFTPRLLIVDAAFRDQAPELRRRAGIASAIHMGPGPVPAEMAGHEALIAAHAPLPDRSGSGEDLCSLCYTGGTTGRSKGVMLTHANLTFAAVNWIASLHFSDETVFLHSAGFFHLAGSIPLFALTMAGGTHVLLPKFDAEAAMATIQRHRVTYCLFVPTMINTLIHHPRSADYDLSSLRLIEYGASPISLSVLEAAMARLPDCAFIQGYGLTEATALTLSLPWRHHFESDEGPSKRAATGRAAYGIDVRIAPPGGGEELPRGEAGEILLRGPQITPGYWNLPEQTAAAFHDGWLLTGDGGFMDADGFVHITDRVKDMIVSGGENVYSKEVENAIFAHPAVQDCAVIAIPSEEWGEAVHAVVVFRAGRTASLEEIRAHCRERLAGYKCPRSLEVRDALPLSAAGKIVKAELRAPWWADRRRSVG